jgi:hypothetical protein
VRLSVDQTIVGDALYIEGSVSYVRLVRRGGGVALQKKLDARSHAVFRVPSGRYRLSSWQRPCDGNCSYLDPPTDRCSRAFVAGGGARLRAKILLRPGRGCRIVLSRSP